MFAYGDSGSSSECFNSETTPLLKERHIPLRSVWKKDGVKNSKPTIEIVEDNVLKKHITLGYAVCSIVASSAGAGIFISPTGVTQYAGSVAASLLIWVASGIFTIILALCYCELGTAFPLAGGDYIYVKKLLGPLPAFLCLWLTSTVGGPIAAALMAQTASEYFIDEFGNIQSTILVVILSVWINITFAGLNIISIKWTTRVLSFLTVIKCFAFSTIIITGIIFLARGYTVNFENAFVGSTKSAGRLAAAFLPGYVSYAGWDTACYLAEEMKNPKRDLPLGTAIAILIVIAINVLMNVAYFTVLSTEEFTSSSVVALSFARKAFPTFAPAIPVFVVLSAVGAITGVYLAYPRYSYAGGREGQFPEVMGYIHKDWFSPLPAILLQCIISILFCCMPFLNLQVMLQIAGVILLIKAFLALCALLFLKMRLNHMDRALKVPSLVVVICCIILAGLIVLAVFEEPLINGMGVLFFALGIPLYFVVKLCKHNQRIKVFLEKTTKILQLTFLIIPVGTKDSKG